MASRDIKDLTPSLQKKAKQIVEECKNNGVELLIYCTLRTLQEQAKLYCQGRTTKQIAEKAASLKEKGFGFLAAFLEKETQTKGKIVTNAGPGESWHNYREAFDAVPIVGKTCLWNYKSNKAKWDVFAKAAENAGIEWGGNWKFKDYPHVQESKSGNPLDDFKPEEIKEMLTKNKCL